MDDQLFFDVGQAREDALEIVRTSSRFLESKADGFQLPVPHLVRIALTNLAPSRGSILDVRPELLELVLRRKPASFMRTLIERLEGPCCPRRPSGAAFSV